MKHLLLMRHGEALNSSKGDLYRRLSELGKWQSKEAGEWIQHSGFIPDFVFYSPTERTTHTMENVLESLGDISKMPKEKLYQATKDRILDVITEAPLTCQNLLVIAHNPGLTELAHHLSFALSNYTMQESAILVFKFEMQEWESIEARPGDLILKKDFQSRTSFVL